ncbi:fatty acid--CoA ligase [Metabacillus arenae]|uniref:Fatty acid--CoA ligase n=1 Tax=Metabacillus arenae TaxID=2771434 RepID=A0A926NMI5_9BACI|nr:fatty acid--CoA ligase [Metabacillus arenae]MBD1383368.1 fatty acid--CoA ligase [Metabacillus arenae]
MYSTIGKVFDLTVEKFPHKEAVYDATKQVRFSYFEWQQEVNKLANAFVEAGVRKGDRISTYLFNTIELATAYFASAKIGAVINPINFRLKEEEVAYILKDAAPKIVLFEKTLESTITEIHQGFSEISFWYVDMETPDYALNYYDQIQDSTSVPIEIDVTDSDPYAIMYTSGTTGRPKGVIHRHRDMIEQSYMCISAKRLTKNDRGLVAAPMFHCAELHCCFLPRVHVGANNVIIHHFEPKQVLQIIEDENITVMFGAPTMWNMILQEKLDHYNISSLRVGLYGAAPMAPVLVKECKERLGIPLIQAYGMTEMGPAITFLEEDEQLIKAGSAGKPGLGHLIRVVKPNETGPSEPNDVLKPYQVGEIIVQGPCMMEGYFNRPEETEKSMYKGWYHSGDLGYFDEDGYLYIADRVDDMVISGGENVYPREVEDVLYEHDGVLDVAVLGEPDEKWGERVIAFVVRKREDLSEQELDKFCKNNNKLAAYKRPRKYIFVESLPRNASGKIQKFLLRKELEQNTNA